MIIFNVSCGKYADFSLLNSSQESSQLRVRVLKGQEFVVCC